MKKMKAYLPLTILTGSFLIALILVMNFQWLAGGFEGLLLKSLQPLMDEDLLYINGRLTIEPTGDDMLKDIMVMDLGIRGEVNQRLDESLIDIELILPHEERQLIAQLKQHDDVLMLIPTREGAEPVDISELLKAYDEDESLEEDWHQFYEQLQIEEVKVMDPRSGKGHLKRSLVQYRLDLLSVLSSEQRMALQQSFGFESMEELECHIECYVDPKGELAFVSGQFNSLMLGIDGWVIFEE